MPIYEYQCSSCGQKKEVLQKLSDAPLKDCPACGKPTLSKLISAAGFQLKGSGWYVTDFRGGKSSKPDAGKAGDTVPEAGKSASADAKPKEEAAAKTEAKTETAPASSGTGTAGQ